MSDEDSKQKKIDHYEAVLAEIVGFYCPSQPETDEGSEYSWAMRHIGKLRGMASQALLYKG